MGDLAKLKSFAKSEQRSALVQGWELMRSDRRHTARPLAGRHRPHRDHSYDPLRRGQAPPPSPKPKKSSHALKLSPPVRNSASLTPGTLTNPTFAGGKPASQQHPRSTSPSCPTSPDSSQNLAGRSLPKAALAVDILPSTPPCPPSRRPPRLPSRRSTPPPPCPARCVPKSSPSKLPAKNP